MEKKQYIMPSVRVKAVKLENQLLQGSGEGDITFNEDGSTGTGNLNDGDATGEGLGKQNFGSHDVWED